MKTKLIEDSGRFTHVHIMQLLILKKVTFLSLQKLMMSQNIFISSDCRTFTFRNHDYGNESVKMCCKVSHVLPEIVLLLNKLHKIGGCARRNVTNS